MGTHQMGGQYFSDQSDVIAFFEAEISRLAPLEGADSHKH
jgi:hypothetical protein